MMAVTVLTFPIPPAATSLSNGMLRSVVSVPATVPTRGVVSVIASRKPRAAKATSPTG